MRSEDERFYEAILCTLIAKAGGSIRLDAADIAAWGNATQLCMKADRQNLAVLLAVDFVRPYRRPRPRAPRHHGQGTGVRGEG